MTGEGTGLPSEVQQQVNQQASNPAAQSRYLRNISSDVVMLNFKRANGTSDGLTIESHDFLDLQELEEDVVRNINPQIRSLAGRKFIEVLPDTEETRQLVLQREAEKLELANPEFVKKLIADIQASTDKKFLHAMCKKYRRYKNIYEHAEQRIFDIGKEESPDVWDATGISS